MRTWNDYKEHVNAVDPEISKSLKGGGRYSCYCDCYG